MMWKCGPCNAEGHDRCQKHQPDPFIKINQMLGLANYDMWCSCDHVSHGLVAPSPEPPNFHAMLADAFEPVICRGIETEDLSNYATALLKVAEVDPDPRGKAARWMVAHVINDVLFARVTEGALSS